MEQVGTPVAPDVASEAPRQDATRAYRNDVARAPLRAPLPAFVERPTLQPFAQFSLRYFGDPVLKVPAITVETLAELERGLVESLVRVMAEHDGLGMAAQQVGGRQRVCVVRLAGAPLPATKMPVRHVHVLLNPRIIGRRGTPMLCPAEGCLSVPGFRTSVRRSPEIVVEFEDRAFVTKRMRLRDLDAQVVQHEVEHLAGVCIADGVSRQQRRDAERLVAKARGAR